MNQPTEIESPRSSKSLALLALLILVPAPSIGTFVSMHLDLGLGGQLVYLLSKVWLAGVPIIWWLWIEKGRWSWSPTTKGGFLPAGVLGIVISIGILVSYMLFGSDLLDVQMLTETAQKNQLDVTWRFVGFAIYLITVNSLLEEYVWRWFVFRKCETLLPGWLAVLASAGLFTIHHVIALKAQMPWAATLLCSTGVFIGGAVWSWCYLRFRSVWPGYLSHALVDLAILIIAWQVIFSS